MLCGGIWPLKDFRGECWMCGKAGARHYCEEWDCFLHGRCVPKFLSTTDEGKVVMDHKHDVEIRMDYD